MVLNVADALKQPGEVFFTEFDHSFEPQQYGGRTIILEKPASVKARYSYDVGAVQVFGEAEFELSSTCARCGESFFESLSISFDERFIKGDAATSESEECYLFDGRSIPFDDMLLHNLFLGLPIASLCKPGCMGLCPMCGANLNDTQCACVLDL